MICEATLDITDPSKNFDSLAWFVLKSNQNLNFPNARSTNPSNITQISISSAFVKYPRMYEDSAFKCCTSLNGNSLLCQNIYLIDGTTITSAGSDKSRFYRLYYFLCFFVLVVFNLNIKIRL